MHNREQDSAFAHFYLRYAHLVTRVVAKKIPPEEVADVAMVAWKSLQAHWPFTHVKNIEAYLTKAAQNAIAGYYRDGKVQKRIPLSAKAPLPEDGPSGAELPTEFVQQSSTPSLIDEQRLHDGLLALGEELSGNNGELLKRFLDDPSSVSTSELRKLKASAKKNVTRLAEDIDPLKEGPSVIGHIAKKIKRQE